MLFRMLKSWKHRHSFNHFKTFWFLFSELFISSKNYFSWTNEINWKRMFFRMLKFSTNCNSSFCYNSSWSLLSGCISLSAVIFYEKIEDIGSYWYNQCKSLKSLLIVSSSLSFGVCCFKGCQALSDVLISKLNLRFDHKIIVETSVYFSLKISSFIIKKC
jgi:hypothetical protein